MSQETQDDVLSGRWIASAALLATVTVWGVQVPVVGWVLQYLGPWETTCLRIILLIPLFGGVLAILNRQEQGVPAVPLGKVLLLASVGLLTFFVGYTMGISYAGPVQASVISSMSPLTSALLVWAVERSRPGIFVWIGMSLAIAGGTLSTVGPILAQGVTDGSGHVAGLGEVLMLLSMLGWGWYSMFAQRWLRGWSTMRITAATLLAGALFLIPVYGIMVLTGQAEPESLARMPWYGWLLLMVTGALASFVGSVFWNFAVGRIGLTMASLYINLTPMVAILISSLIGAVPTLWHLGGGMLVIAGVLIPQIARLRQQTS